jgi:hypothetical protein
MTQTTVKIDRHYTIRRHMGKATQARMTKLTPEQRSEIVGQLLLPDADAPQSGSGGEAMRCAVLARSARYRAWRTRNRRGSGS